jgi:hypothetical protein
VNGAAKVTVRWFDGTAEVDGWPCGVDGLAITRWVTSGEGLHITHVRSGAVVAIFADADPEAVLAAALEMGSLADWTVSGPQLQAMRETGRKVAEVVWRWGGEMPDSPGLAADLTGAAA